MSELYLGLGLYREMVDGELDEDPQDEMASVGPFRCIAHTFCQLRCFDMDDHEYIPHFYGDFLVVDGKYWSDYYFFTEPQEWNMDPADPKTFAEPEKAG